MSTAVKRLLSPQEYLAIERRGEKRSEYFRGKTFEMPVENWRHESIKSNLAAEAGRQLRNETWHVATTNLRIKVSDEGFYTYSDVVFFGSHPQFEDNIFDTLLDPHVICEVYSDDTEAYDRGRKFAHYRALHSLQEYVLIADHASNIDRYVRLSNGNWSLIPENNVNETCDFATIPVRIPLTEIYRGMEFSDAQLGRPNRLSDSCI